MPFMSQQGGIFWLDLGTDAAGLVGASSLSLLGGASKGDAVQEVPRRVGLAAEEATECQKIAKMSGKTAEQNVQ